MKNTIRSLSAVFLAGALFLSVSGCRADDGAERLDEILSSVQELRAEVDAMTQEWEEAYQAALEAEEEARRIAMEEEEARRLAAEEEEARRIAEEAAIQRIGVEREGDRKIRLYNETGMEISSVVVNDLTTGESTGELMGEGEVFPEHERAYLCFPAVEGDEYEVVLGWPDGSSFTMHSFPAFRVDEAQLIWGSHVAYLEYVDTQTGEAASTLDNETAIREQRLAEEEEARRAAEAAAAAAAAAAQSNSYGNNSGNSGDGCLDDALFW